jgi:hypothetical protein
VIQGALTLGRSGSLYTVRKSILSADRGHEREIQHPAIGDGQLRKVVQVARYAGRYRESPNAVLPTSCARRDRVPKRLVCVQR